MSKKSVWGSVSLTITFIFISISSFCANRYWVGTGNWNNTASWSNISGGIPGFSVPTGGDTAIFDGGNMNNCIINANVNIAAFRINATYSGIIGVNIGITTIVGSGGFSQAGGTFTGNNGNITISGLFSLTGGTFTSTTGTLHVTGFTRSIGIFNHNGGSVTFSGTQTITGNTIFYNVFFVANNGTYTIAGGTTITSINNVTISGAAYCLFNTGTLEIQGNLTLTSSSNNSINGGSATFLFNGTGIQNISSAVGTITLGTNEKVCALPNIEINKISGSLNLSGIININGTSWKTTAGSSLINPGTSTVNLLSNVTFSGQDVSLYNIHIYANGEIITLTPATYLLTSTNNVIINGTSHYKVNTGSLQILGDLTLINTGASAVNGGTGTFLFNGTGTQNINSTASGLDFICALPNVKINKTSGTLNLSGIINFNGTSWNTVAGASLVNAGTSVVNIMNNSTLSGQNLSLYDINITGNFNFITISAGLVWTSTHLITLAGNANFYQINTGTLNAKGNVLVTNTSTSNSGGGSAVLLFDGADNQTLTGSGIAGGGKLPKVEINKTGGVLTFSNNIISTDNSWTYIAGNVDANTNASTINFTKAAIVDGQGTSNTMAFHHVIISGTVILGGNMDLDGNLTITSAVGDKLDVDPTNHYQVNIAGNWLNNNSVTTTSFNQRNGRVIFDGTNAQSLTLASSSHIETYHNIEMNNTGSGLTLHAPITVSNNLHLVDGNIISSTSNILLLNDLVTSIGASNNSFVDGPIRKTGNQAFSFPVGKNLVYAPIAISAPGINTHQFTAEYFQADPNVLYPVSTRDIALDHISRCEYWILDRNIGASNVTVNLSWDTRSCGITAMNDLRVSRWDGSQWKDHGNGATTGTTVAGTVVSSTPISSFSPFTLASSSAANPLPIELISFMGHCEGRDIVLNWATASEINNDYFTLEYSPDAGNWTNIGMVPGAGNSVGILNYSFIYPNPNHGISYFRLTQTDYDGNFEIFEPIAAEECDGDMENNNLVLYPNPSNGIFNLLSNGNQTQIHALEIYNAQGDIIYLGNTQSVDLSTQPAGMYTVRISTKSETFVKKIILKK